jgi:hypothetical protein
MDERSAWLQRLDRQQEQEQQFKPKHEPRVNNASKLLAQRGFTTTGTLERPVEEDDGDSSGVSVGMELQPAGPVPAAGPARRATGESAQDCKGDRVMMGVVVLWWLCPWRAHYPCCLAPLRRVQMLDDAGKAHPMIQAAQRQVFVSMLSNTVLPPLSAVVSPLSALISWPSLTCCSMLDHHACQQRKGSGCSSDQRCGFAHEPVA